MSRLNLTLVGNPRAGVDAWPRPNPVPADDWLITIVLLGIAVNFWQTYRSQQAADRLRASVAPS
jgi:hypothetical protein